MNKIIKNIAWLLFDKVFILILQFFVGVKIANYYGSESFGLYNYAISLVSFSAILFELLNDRVVKKYFQEENFTKIIHNFNIFRNSMAILIFVIIAISGKFMNLTPLFYYTLILLCVDNLLITSTQGVEIYFDYKLNSKNLVILNNIVKLISYTLQYLGMILGYSIILIPITRCIGSGIRILLLRFMYKKIYLKDVIIQKKYDFSLIKNILKESFFLWISYIGFLIYTQTDRIMLGSMLGVKEVGVYSIAFNLVSILSILISPIQVSIFPKMLELYEKDRIYYLKFYLSCNTFITQIYLVGIIFSIIIVNFLFLKIFSFEYQDSIQVYSILTLSVFFRANGALQTGHMTIKSTTKKMFFKAFSGVIINILLNLFLIPIYKVKGAAFATVITYFFTLFILDFFIPEYREQAIIQLKSLNPFYLKNIFEYIKKTRG